MTSMPRLPVARQILPLLLLGSVSFAFQSPRTVGKPTPESLAKLRAAAEAGDAKSQAMLASLTTDKAEAAGWYRKAAEQGLALAQYGLGMAYELGQGVPKDPPQAAVWLRKAADRGEVNSQYEMGVVCLLGLGIKQDYPEAAGWFRKAAGQRQAKAAVALGFLYEAGRGVPRDSAEAAGWFAQGGGASNSGVQFQVGNFFFMTGDFSAAAAWFGKSAQQGDAGSQIFLGMMHVNGQGLPKDPVQAFKWLTWGIAGLPPAQRASPEAVLQKLTGSMTEAQIEEAKRLAAAGRPGPREVRAVKEEPIPKK